MSVQDIRAADAVLRTLETEVQRWREETWPGLPLRASLTVSRRAAEPALEMRLALVWPGGRAVCAYETWPEPVGPWPGVSAIAREYAARASGLMALLTPEPPGECYRPEGVP